MTEPIANADDHRAGNSRAEGILVNFFEAHNNGHVIEALHYCLGHHKANPESRLSVLLNALAPTELAQLCPCVETVYPVELQVTPKIPRACPRRTAWLRYEMCPASGITCWTTTAGA